MSGVSRRCSPICKAAVCFSQVRFSTIEVVFVRSFVFASVSKSIFINSGLESVSFFSGSLLGSSLRAVLVKLHEFSKIELGLLEYLSLADKDVVKREDLGALLSDSLANLVGEPGEKI